MALKLRTVVFSLTAQTRIESLYGGAELADAACSGFMFVLAHDPSVGTRISTDMWMIEMEGVGVWQSVVAFYSFDSNIVVVHDVVSV